MKVPSSSSFLLATLAVSSSSSALVPPPPETHQEAPLSSASSALVASSSSGSLAPYQTGFSQREFAPESVEQRAILDILPLACQLVHTLTDKLPTPIPALVGVLCSPGPTDGKGSPNQAKAHKELSKISDALQQAVFVSGVSISSSTPATVPSSNGGVDGDNSRVNATSSASFVPTPSESASASLIPSASSTAWRFQPTPANSPSLPVDDLEGR